MDSYVLHETWSLQDAKESLTHMSIKPDPPSASSYPVTWLGLIWSIPDLSYCYSLILPMFLIMLHKIEDALKESRYAPPRNWSNFLMYPAEVSTTSGSSTRSNCKPYYFTRKWFLPFLSGVFLFFKTVTRSTTVRLWLKLRSDGNNNIHYRITPWRDSNPMYISFGQWLYSNVANRNTGFVREDYST